VRAGVSIQEGVTGRLLTRDLPVEIVRRCYAEEIRFSADVRSHALAEAFAAVPRENYCGQGPWELIKSGGHVLTESDDPRLLYHDVLISIDPQRNLNNGQPSAVARWLDELDLQPGHRVFHIGCGLGYYTAIMAHVVGRAGHVRAVDIDAGLASRARANLAPLDNVEVLCADGVTFDPGEVNAIMVNAGVTHPQPLWVDRLRDGGRLMVPLTTMRPDSELGDSTGGAGHYLLVRRRSNKYEASFVSSVGIYSSPSGRNPAFNAALAQSFRDTLHKGPDIHSLRRDPHRRDKTCWLHGEGFCLSTLE
jgi:protein-L-isoaspartate(D-aspartate) O-methyltransferase